VLTSSSATRGRKISAEAVSQPVCTATQMTKPSGTRASSDTPSAAPATHDRGQPPPRLPRVRGRGRATLAGARVRAASALAGRGMALKTELGAGNEQPRYSRPAWVIRSVTFLLLSFEGSTLGACRSASGTSLGWDCAPTPTAYS